MSLPESPDANLKKMASFGTNQTFRIPLNDDTRNNDDDDTWQPVIKKRRSRSRKKKNKKDNIRPRKVHLLTVSNHEQASKIRGALVDRGANGGVAGSDARLIQGSGRQVDVAGIDDHKIKNVKITLERKPSQTHVLVSGVSVRM